MEESHVTKLEVGQWHLPYIDHLVNEQAGLEWYFSNGMLIDLKTAIDHSAAACAQVSYRTLDMSPEKVKRIVEKLSDRSDPHLSPFEHQATPLTYETNSEYDVFPEGATSLDKDGNFWSGNFKGWAQNRQLMEQETYVV